MSNIFSWLLDEKVVFGFLAIVFSSMAIYLIKTNADKEFVGAFLSMASGFAGALTRGIIGQLNASQNTTSTTTVTPKE